LLQGLIDTEVVNEYACDAVVIHDDVLM